PRSSHPEYAEAGGRNRRVTDDGEAAPEHIARGGGRDHAVVPQPRAGVIGMPLRRILLAYLIGARLLFFRLALILSRVVLDAQENLSCLFAAHHRDARIRPHEEETRGIGTPAHGIIA